MDVLRLSTSNYTLTISTANIDYAWTRFCRRVSNAINYCNYQSSRMGTLAIYYPYGEQSSLRNVNKDEQIEWTNLHPILFETNEYQFAVEFNDIYNTKIARMLPKVRHQMKSVGESFKFYPITKDDGKFGGILVGTINFINSPGKFNFSFEYYLNDGSLIKDKLEMYVASPKLDTKNDLKEITALINEEYENYVFDYLTLTFSSYSLTKTEHNNNIIWFSIFKNVVENYFKNIKFIMSRPNNKPIHKTYIVRPAKIRHWSQREAELFKDRQKDAEHYYYRYEQIENTINTKENRFVKYTLRVLGKKFYEIFGEINVLYKDMDNEECNELEQYNILFKRLQSDKFFKKVGEFEGFRQESAILQQRTGYSQIYKAWIMLKNSLDLIEGKTDIGMKKIWELYEIWCFLIMKRLIAKVLNIDLHDKDHIEENKGEMLDTFTKSELSHTIIFHANNGDKVKLEYQHTYNRQSEDSFKTVTTEQRPDIVISIIKPNGFVLTYLYDAKYRVQDDVTDVNFDKDVDIDLADYPLPDAINQMHRYRDAIYYAMKEDERPQGKEIIGGYILFPGRVEGDKIYERYFIKSIEKVNIGAFPLLPTKAERNNNYVQCDLLEKHLRKILLEDSITEHIKDSIPQKGLAYSFAPKDENILVLVGFCKDEHQWNTILKNKMYYVRAGMISGSLRLVPGFEHCKYILLYNTKQKAMYELSGAGPRLVSGKELQKKGFDANHDFYLCFDLKDTKPHNEFIDPQNGKDFKINPSLNPYKKEPYFSTLKEIIEPTATENSKREE